MNPRYLLFEHEIILAAAFTSHNNLSSDKGR